MTDDTIETGSTTPIPFPDRQIDPPEPEIVEPATTLPAREQLAAVQEKLLGPNVALHEGKPERGVGSKYHALHPAHKAHIAAIEHLVEVEAEHAAAEARLTAVHAKVQRALDRVAATEEAANAVEKETI